MMNKDNYHQHRLYNSNAEDIWCDHYRGWHLRYRGLSQSFQARHRAYRARGKEQDRREDADEVSWWGASTSWCQFHLLSSQKQQDCRVGQRNKLKNCAALPNPTAVLLRRQGINQWVTTKQSKWYFWKTQKNDTRGHGKSGRHFYCRSFVGILRKVLGRVGTFEYFEMEARTRGNWFRGITQPTFSKGLCQRRERCWGICCHAWRSVF